MLVAACHMQSVYTECCQGLLIFYHLNLMDAALVNKKYNLKKEQKIAFQDFHRIFN